MKHMKNLALATILAFVSLFAFAQAPTQAASDPSVVDVATEVRDQERKLSDAREKALAAIALKEADILKQERLIPSQKEEDRPAARAKANRDRAELEIARKRLEQGCSKCVTSSPSRASASVAKTQSSTHVSPTTRDNAALLAELTALKRRIAENGTGVKATAQVSAGTTTASAYAAAEVTTQMVAVQTGSSAGYPANGQEVCDAIGNCSRSTQGGSMVCQNAINGKILEYDFAPLGITQEQARSYCRASGDRFLARHRSTTPDQSGMTSVSAVPSALPVAVQPAPSKSAGKITCEFKVDGVVRESYPVTSEQECSTSNHSKAQALGLVAVR